MFVEDPQVAVTIRGNKGQKFRGTIAMLGQTLNFKAKSHHADLVDLPSLPDKHKLRPLTLEIFGKKGGTIDLSESQELYNEFYKLLVGPLKAHYYSLEFPSTGRRVWDLITQVLDEALELDSTEKSSTYSLPISKKLLAKLIEL